MNKIYSKFLEKVACGDVFFKAPMKLQLALGGMGSGGRRRFWVTAQKRTSTLGGRGIITIDAAASETPPDPTPPAPTATFEII